MPQQRPNVRAKNRPAKILPSPLEKQKICGKLYVATDKQGSFLCRK